MKKEREKETGERKRRKEKTEKVKMECQPKATIAMLGSS